MSDSFTVNIGGEPFVMDLGDTGEAMRQAALAGAARDAAVDAKDQAETARDIALGAGGLPSYASQALGEAATATDDLFRVVDPATGLTEIYIRTVGGSDPLPGPYIAADKVDVADGRNGQEALDAKVEYPRSSREITGGVVPTNYLAEYSHIDRFNPTANVAIAEAYATMSGANSTYPSGDPQFNTRGRGTHRFDKKRYDFGSTTVPVSAAYGLIFRGEGVYATGLEYNSNTGALFDFTTYLGLKFTDLAIANRSATRGDSIGIKLNPTNGGQNFSLHNVEFKDFDTCVQVGGTQNGDTNLFINTIMQLGENNVGFKLASGNTQSLINMFLQPVSGCDQAFIRTESAGECVTLGANMVVDESILQLSDGAGSNACRFLFDSCKIEYGYGVSAGAMLLVDDREGVTYGGRGASVMWRNTSLEGGQYQPADRDAHTVMALGRKIWQVDLFANKIQGTITHDTTGIGTEYDNVIWRIHDNVRAPKGLLITGSRSPLVSYKGNGNIPDHYRGGATGNRIIDAEKVFAYRSSSSTIINTGVAADQSTGGGFGARYGYERTISTGLPHKTRIMRIGVDVDSYGGAASDTKIELCQSAGTAATGSIAFSGQPTADSTVTINGVVWTFKASGATGNQVNIGANTTATVTALAAALNASNNPKVSPATYAGSTTTLNITFDLHGTEGNAFTIAAGSGSNGTPSGATLAGGNYTGSFTTVLETITIPSGQLGLHIVDLPKTPCYMLHQGNLHLRVSRNALSTSAAGTLNVWYYPWVR